MLCLRAASVGGRCSWSLVVSERVNYALFGFQECWNIGYCTWLQFRITNYAEDYRIWSI